jgi:hypothetical protein
MRRAGSARARNIDKKREGRLASPFSKYRSLQGPQPKQECYFLPFFLAFFLALPLAFAFLLAAILIFLPLSGEASPALQG